MSAFARSDDAAHWENWVRGSDQEVRARIDRGVEDSISNLVLFGTSFTRLPRLESVESAVNPAGELVEAATARVKAAAAALSGSAGDERLRFARDFLSRRRSDTRSWEQTLAANLKRFALEQRGYQETLQQPRDPGETRFVRATLFEHRGLSVDTALLPNFAIEDTLRVMLNKGAMAPGSVRHIGIIGPGLDFADKREGYDIYPLQSIQPFAVMDGVIRLGLGKADDVHVTTCDLNPAVNSHLKAMADRARAGRPYVLQLPRLEAADWTPAAIEYWTHFGDAVAVAATPVPAPGGLILRAVAVRPRFASRIQPMDLNVVAQVADFAPGSGFDLVVATNILVYYDRFQQALAMASIARMMNSGGIFLSNTVLPADRPEALEFLGRRSVSYSVSGSYGDDVVAYRRR